MEWYGRKSLYSPPLFSPLSNKFKRCESTGTKEMANLFHMGTYIEYKIKIKT